jgi:hypothetical protein
MYQLDSRQFKIVCLQILFYNTIFMDKLQAFALRFKRSRVNTDAPPLSPLPKLRAHPQSPCRKISDAHPVWRSSKTPGPVFKGLFPRTMKIMSHARIFIHRQQDCFELVPDNIHSLFV